LDVQVRIHFAVLRTIIFVLLAKASFAEAQKTVTRVVIDSSSGGLGSGAATRVVIKRKGDKFLSNTRMVEIYSTSRSLKTRVMKQKEDKSLFKNRPVSTAQVQSLVDALSAAPLIAPDLKNLGITEEWLAAKVESQWPPARIRGDPTTADQESYFKKSFTSLKSVANRAPDLFALIYHYINDYAAYCKVEIVFDDGSKLSAESESYFVFMLPWNMNGRRGAYNYTRISRAPLRLSFPSRPTKRGSRGMNWLPSSPT
jgi:hypothetical protein